MLLPLAFKEKLVGIMETIKHVVESGEPLMRGARKITITDRGQGHDKNFPMPGWYSKDNDEGTLTDEDMQVYDRAIC